MAMEREMPDSQALASHARRVWMFEYLDGERVVGVVISADDVDSPVFVAVADEVGCIHLAVRADALRPCSDPAWASMRDGGGWVPVSSA
ncbi:MAG: hypothetical protein JNG53_03015 [Senegalimassilia sp.]|nr:hypothetical protein [Senegalimassilia sp.]